ncbi:hypothetical protein DLJ47_07655 [Micromonospora sp. S4605]|uniref:hypothetical protein n=1 Tax=Micromonospora sp. S4605 TaxID=1420897 RepID=UPI000D6FD629|nr:hypothetical protein [Micromonospora sp. S4605]PWU56108.1 hypothetical protein DLJ47_07655 [Micromonospora sp. S4605]
MRPKTAACAALLATLTACTGTNAATEGDGGGPSVIVVEPASGATVPTPFTVKIDSNVPLGPSESGQHHVHIWFDDNESDYLIVESDTVQITAAPAGQHTMHVSLRNANHSPAGAEATTPITVGGGGPVPSSSAGGDGASPTSAGTDPYSY